MSWVHVVVAVIVGLLAAVAGLYILGRRLQKHEPYASFMRLPTRRKLTFFRMLGTDPRVPRRAKVLPLLLAGYLALPIDLIPDFIPVLGFVDDIAITLGTLALIVRLTPRSVVDDVLSQLTDGNSS